MKKGIVFSILILLSVTAGAQVREGRILYERTQQLQIQLQGEDQALERMIPKERKDRFEWLFAGNQSVWQSAGDEPDAGEMSWNSGGAEVRLVVPGSNDIIFVDYARKIRVEQRELMTKTLILEDSLRPYVWKLGSETKTILGHNCRKATAQRTQEGFRVNVDNGQMNRVSVIDTMNVTAWYTDAIPLPGGPEQYVGQLPGAILELEVNKGRTRFTAIEYSPRFDVKKIREPKGKKLSPEEFKAEREKMFKEMEKNGGGMMQIRTGGN